MSTKKLDPVLMAVLANRMEGITREVLTVMLRSGRSVMLNACRDFSTAILTGDCRMLAVAEGLPVHVLTAGRAVKPILEFFEGDIRPGDVFLNNCPYTGNSHHADFTMALPVFWDDEIMFWVVNRTHQNDVGASMPTTYLPYAADIYSESLHFPCVRIQRDREDVKDIIRICMMKIRQPQQWYGDYLAQVGSLRIGERRLMSVCEKYGKEKVKQFVEEYLAYGSRRMKEEIRKMPKGTWAGEAKMDPLDFAPEGATVRAEVSIDPEEGLATIDLTASDDQVPGGINGTEATVIAAAMTAFFYSVDPTVPHNEGSASRVHTILREGSVAGIPRYPVGTSVCTTYNFDRVVSAVLRALTVMDPASAFSEPAVVDACISVTSGVDFRRNDEFYAHEVFKGGSAGPASAGHDGWAGWGAPCGSGAQYWESVEIHELRYPHIWWAYEAENGTCPSGKWISGPRTRFLLAPRESTMMVASFGDGRVFRPRGVLGGQDGPGADSYLVDLATGERVQQLPLVCMQPVEKGQGWECLHGTAASFGDPLERDPELVRWNAREGLITLQQAKDDYGVVLNTEPELYQVDHEATQDAREKLVKERESGSDANKD